MKLTATQQKAIEEIKAMGGTYISRNLPETLQRSRATERFLIANGYLETTREKPEGETYGYTRYTLVK